MLGDAAVVALIGLRTPCGGLDHFRPGLMAAMLDRDAGGNLIRKSGVMGIVLADGTVRPGDAIRVALPQTQHRALRPV